MPPLVSVVIPAHNAEAFLAEAIASVLDQTYPCVEALVVDDGSTDGTGAIARGFGASVRCLRQENAGPGAARNTGLAHARGEYVAFLDADDAFRPERVAVMVAALRHASPDAAFVTTDAAIWDGRQCRRVFRISRPSPGERGLTAFLDETWCYIGILARRESLLRVGGFRRDLWRCEDYDLWLRLLSGGHTYAYVPEPLYLYRVQEHSLSNDRHRQMLAAHQVDRDALRTLPLTLSQRRRLLHLLWEDRASLFGAAAAARRARGSWAGWAGQRSAWACCQAARVLLRPQWTLARAWGRHQRTGQRGGA
ncbi:MAG: glycosyltransferase [Armatimonadetes bacterium]|nr:glycosyltransferase [Armatimonadota bacterium]